MLICLIYTKINKNISCSEKKVQTLTTYQYVGLNEDKDEEWKFVLAQQWIFRINRGLLAEREGVSS